MAYNVPASDGSGTIAVVQDYTLNTATNIILVGKDYSNYAVPIATSFVRLLENFAAPIAPGQVGSTVAGNPRDGQLWFNNSSNRLNVCIDGEFVSIYGSADHPIDIYANRIYAVGTDPRLNGNWTVYGAITLSTGSTMQATYADLAERFSADSKYPVGTIVKVGGTHEVTAVSSPYSVDSFGVVSATPAHILNATAGPDETHPPIALAGRVEVRVKGKVKKGDRIVSSDVMGVGMAADLDHPDIALASIGRSLENKLSDTESLIWVAVGTK